MPVVLGYGDSNTHGYDAATTGRFARDARWPGVLAGVLALVALVAAGCLTAHDVITDRPWTLVEIRGVPPIADAGVSFGTDGRFTVKTGCNSGGGTYHLEGNRILLDSETLTAQACDGAVGDQEAAMLAVVEGRPRYEIETGTGRLRLAADSGEVLLFEAP